MVILRVKVIWKANLKLINMSVTGYGETQYLATNVHGCENAKSCHYTCVKHINSYNNEPPIL